MDAGLRAVPHGIHEDDRQELGEHNPHSWPHQLVSDHLGKERGRLLSHCRILRVTEEVQQIDQGTCGQGREGEGERERERERE